MALCDNTNIDKSSPTNYELVFPLIPTETTISANKPLVLNIFGSIIPSVSINETEIEWQSTKRKIVGSSLLFDQWNANFNIDSNFNNWKIIFNWMSYINNNYNKHMEEFQNYSVDASLRILDNFKQSILNLKFISIWPNNLSEVTLNQRDGETLIECNVNFSYDYFKII